MPFDGVSLPKVTSNLIAARDTIVNFGWIQHRAWSRRGVCMLGAFSGATFSEIEEANLFLLDAIYDLGFGKTNSVPGFQDQRGRTKEQVISVYDRAIELSICSSASA